MGWQAGGRAGKLVLGGEPGWPRPIRCQAAQMTGGWKRIFIGCTHRPHPASLLLEPFAGACLRACTFPAALAALVPPCSPFPLPPPPTHHQAGQKPDDSASEPNRKPALVN